MIDQKEHKNNRYKFEPATWCYKHHSTAHVCIVDAVHVFYFCTKFSTQGHLAHAVMNIDENLSVTENPFHLDSLEDWVHG